MQFITRDSTTVGDLFTFLKTATHGQGEMAYLQRVCDVCSQPVGDTECREYKCNDCGNHFDVAHNCQPASTSQCPPGFGCQKK